MPVRNKHPVAYIEKRTMVKKASEWLCYSIGIAGIFTATFFLTFPARSENQPPEKPDFFENLTDKSDQFVPPVCSGKDVTEKFRPSEKRRFLKRAKKIVNGNTRFWKVEKKGIKPSYLYGTMHITDPDVVNLAEPVKEALDHVDRVILELSEVGSRGNKLTAEELDSSIDLMVVKEGESFKDKLQQDDFEKFNATLQAQGLSYSMIANIKPSLIWMTLSYPTCEIRRRSNGHKILDEEIEENAQKLGKPVIRLETRDEQLATLDDLPIRFYAYAIEDYFDNPDLYANLFYTGVKLYKNNRMDELFVLNSMFKSNILANDQKIFEYIMLTKRNFRMVERALPFVKQGNNFIAVGAAHLIGEHGLVEQFRKSGYRVTPIKF